MIYCIAIGMFTGFIFLSCILFCVTDVQQVIASPRGPLVEVFMQSTGSKAGATCLMMFPLVCVIFALTSIMCTSSRMTWAFARDQGMPFSRIFAKVHPRFDMPLNALLWTTGWVIAFGFIFLGSSAAFNAITSASVVGLGITYAIPPAINCLRMRRTLPENRAFKLNGAMGWILNLVSIITLGVHHLANFVSDRHLLDYPYHGPFRISARASRHAVKHELLCHCLRSHVSNRGWNLGDNRAAPLPRPAC